jgi:hypothetical protein
MMPMLALFFTSILFAPWWLSVAVGCFLLTRYNAWFPVILGGLAVDMLYGAPVQSLQGYAFIYATLFAVLSLASMYLRDTMLE